MANQDLRARLPGGKNVPQVSRHCELRRVVDFAAFPLPSGDTMDIFDIPKGFVREQQDVILLTAEGGTATIDIGISGATDSILDGGNINGTPNTIVAKGTNAATVARTLFSADTKVTILANNALDAAKILIVISGYMVDL